MRDYNDAVRLYCPSTGSMSGDVQQCSSLNAAAATDVEKKC